MAWDRNGEINVAQVSCQKYGIGELLVLLRCSMTTVDPDSPEAAHVKKQPLETLNR
jgi:uncharacterized protein YcbX